MNTPDRCDIVLNYEYDGYGNVAAQSVPYAVSVGSGYRTPLSQPETTTVYDLLSRPRTVTATDGTFPQRYTYLDLETQVKDNANNITRNLLDVWGRTVQVIPPAGPSVSYSYYSTGNLYTATRGGVTTTLYYDYAGRKTQISDPDMGSWYYTYDALGNLKTQKDARCSGVNCVVTNLNYDELNRVIQKSYTIPAGLNVGATPTVNYTYDAGGAAANGIGHRTSMTDGSGSTTWTYDVRGNISQESKVVNSTTFLSSWTYNSADLLRTMTYPSNGGTAETVTYTYHPQMTLNSAIGTSTYVKSTTYAAAGQVDVREIGISGGSAILKTDYDYFPWTTTNGQGRLKRIKTDKLTTPTDVLQDLRYYSGTDTSAYSAVGNLLNIYDYEAGGTQTQTFTYDAASRLLSGAASGGTGGTYTTETYGYNSTTGNLESKAGATYTYILQSLALPETATCRMPWLLSREAKAIPTIAMAT